VSSFAVLLPLPVSLSTYQSALGCSPKEAGAFECVVAWELEGIEPSIGRFWNARNAMAGSVYWGSKCGSVCEKRKWQCSRDIEQWIEACCTAMGKRQ